MQMDGRRMNPINDNNNANLAVQGTTAAFVSGYMYDQYIAMFPWFVAAIPLILLDLRLGRQRARKNGESVTIRKSVKMTIDKSFSYICWIMLATTLSSVFDTDSIKYSIMGIIYGLEVGSCLSAWLFIKYDIELDLLEFLRLLFRFAWGKYTGMEEDFIRVLHDHKKKNKRSVHHE